jgi:alpha-2-macroglobulin
VFQIYQRPSSMSPRTSKALKTLGTYLAIILAAFAFNLYRLRANHRGATQDATEQTYASKMADAKPFFSLSTNRSFRVDERARLSATYQGIDHLDFRVYRVMDPTKFFQQLPNPHRIGENEKPDIERDYQQSPSILERTHSVKSWIYSALKQYVRGQLKREHRQSFNQKFRAEAQTGRVPLNVADYARVPLLNPNQLVSSWRERLPSLQDEYEQRTVSLGRRDPGVYLVEAVNGDLRAYCVAIVTNLTMVQKTTSDGEVMVYVVNRQSGAPHEGVNILVTGERQTLATGATGKGGIFKTEIEVKRPETEAQGQESEDEEDASGGSYLVMASLGDEFAISDLDSFYYGVSDEEGNDRRLNSYIYTDRPVYRPAQKVYFRGILRRRTKSGYEMADGQSVSVTIGDFNGAKLSEQQLPLSPLGTFSGEVELPEEAPLGSYQITARVGAATASHYFSVEEYKKPEYKVKVTASKAFAAAGERVKFSIDARYFFGSPVADAEVQYYIHRSRYYHSWWTAEEEAEGEFDDTETMGDDDDDGSYASGYGGDLVDEGTGQLDAGGRMTVEFEVPEPNEMDQWDYTYTLQAQVSDASRRQMQASAGFTGTRGRHLAYAQPERYVYYQGERARINIRTGNYLGQPVSARVTLKFIEQRWVKVERENSSGYKYSDYESHERELSSEEVETSAQGTAAYDYTIPSTGNIHIKAILHEGGREVINRGGSFWASDRRGTESDFSFRDYGERSIKLIPDKKSYQPGETAHVLAVLPVDRVHLLVTTELLGVMTARQLDATGRTLMIDVPIESSYEPNIYLSVSYVKDDDLYTQDQLLVVPARDKFLKVEILPNKKEYKPRETASYTISARNPDGTPAAGAEVSLGVVDEAVYSIMPENAGSLRSRFYGRQYNEVETRLAGSFSFTGYSGRESIQLAKNRPSYELADFKSDTEFAEASVRRLFKDTAFWQASVITGRDGRATLSFKLPDNLTTWRATARAVTADTRVGSAVEKVVARKDVIMRLEMPRFLTEGDTATISGVVHNFLKTKKRTRISLEVAGAELLDASTETLMIPSMGQRRIDWRVQARQVGEIRLLARALTNTESDAVEITIPVVPHGLQRTLGGVQTITEDEADKTIELDLPDHTDVQARTLRIEASPSVAATLFGALDYLTGYPYGCTEQTMSRFLPNIIVAQALMDVPQASISEKNNLDEKVRRGLDRLYSLQHDDGGWGWWKSDASDPFMTAYVIDGLILASRAGYSVDEGRLNAARDRLRMMLDAVESFSYGGNQASAETRAYMIYALTESGDPAYLDELYRHRTQLQPYGRALLALALKHGNDHRAAEVAGELASMVSENEFDAHWEARVKSHYGNEQVMDVEATALSLKALAEIAPQSTLLPKAARWLIGHRRQGHYWDSTRETAFALFGLTEYVKVSRELEPDYTLEVYVNGERVIHRRVTGADAQSAQTFIVERKGRGLGATNRVRIVKRGRGTLYLSTTLRYFTNDEDVAPQSSSALKLVREYLRLRVTENDGKLAWTVEPLAGELRVGDYIVSRLTLQGGGAQYLMIEDPIPAGCTQVANADGLTLNYSTGKWTDWYSAREFRDERTLFFLSSFDGDATFQYAMRVEVPGAFRGAPARAELMYQPTVQSNTGNTRLTLLDKKLKQ